MEGTVAGVRDRAIGLQDLEETTAVERHVQRVFSSLQATRGEALLSANNAHTRTQLQARRQLAVLGRLGTGLAAGLVEQVLEFSAITFEAGGRDVGQVVGNGGQVHVLSGQTGFTHPKSRKHAVLLVRLFYGATSV
ncbi:hypothetical protein D3C72_1437230 [compost metagenome]